MASGGDPSYLRRINSAAVLKALHTEGLRDPSAGLTVSQLAAAVKVSRPTAEEASEALNAAGWVEQLGPEQGVQRSAGRPARRFRFQPTAGYVLGLAIEPDAVHAAVADLAGTIVATTQRRTSRTLDAPSRLAAADETIAAVLAEARVDTSRVLGVAAGTPGIIDPTGRVIGDGLPGWEGLELADRLAQTVPAPVVVKNRLNLAALGERWKGASQNADQVVHLDASSRMRLAFVIEGQAVAGFHGAAGESTPDGARLWQDAYGILVEHPLADADARPVFEAAAAGDADAQAATETFIDAVFPDIARIIAAFDPEVAVIAGDLSLAGAATADRIADRLARSSVYPPTVRVSELGDDAVVLGAIRVALDEVEATLFDPSTIPGLD